MIELFSDNNVFVTIGYSKCIKLYPFTPCRLYIYNSAFFTFQFCETFLCRNSWVIGFNIGSLKVMATWQMFSTCILPVVATYLRVTAGGLPAMANKDMLSSVKSKIHNRTYDTTNMEKTSMIYWYLYLEWPRLCHADWVIILVIGVQTPCITSILFYWHGLTLIPAWICNYIYD